jgi:hypothetical protein
MQFSSVFTSHSTLSYSELDDFAELLLVIADSDPPSPSLLLEDEFLTLEDDSPSFTDVLLSSPQETSKARKFVQTKTNNLFLENINSTPLIRIK